MPKRHRIRARARRPIETAVRVERGAADRVTRRHRAAPIAAGIRATGEPSPVLERAATLERQYVLKDGRKLGIVVGVMLALLIVAGLVTSALLR